MPPDHGPIYFESDFTQFPVEPWATWSEFLFLAVILYWAWKIRRHPRLHAFIAFSLPLLFIQFVGATVYHATRSHVFWMLMDVLPLYAVCLAAAGYFWLRAGMSRLWVVPAVLVFPALAWGAQRVLLGHYSALLTYSGYFAALALPALAAGLGLTGDRRLLAPGALLCLALALTARTLDPLGLLPMGTHWLWHGFGALAIHLLIATAYALDLRSNGLS